MKNTLIKVKDKTQFGVVIDLMLSSGRQFGKFSTMAVDGKDYANKVYDRFPHPYIDGYNDITSHTGSFIKFDYSWPEDATAIINLLFSKTYEVNDVGPYKAKITDKGIEVGCQIISFEKFEEIAAKIAEFKADQ